MNGEPTGWLKPPKTKAALERQIAELRVERDEHEAEARRVSRDYQSLAEENLANHRAKRAAEADKARLSEALERLANWPSGGNTSGQTNMEKFARAALSGSGAGGWRTECATHGCGKPATAYFERSGVGSHYCHDCYMRVQALPAAPTGEAS